MKTITTWKKDLEFESSFDGHTIELNGSSGPDGRRLGFGPKALLLSGLAGCSGIDVVEILRKMKIEFNGLEIDAHSEQTDEHPKIFKEIFITYRINTAPENEDKIKRAVALSLEKYCGVAAMLSKNSNIISEVEIVS